MGEMMIALGLLAVTMLLWRCPDLPVSRWLAGMSVIPLARGLNRTTPRQWAVVIAGAAVIGLAIWFEIDEIRMLAGAGGSVGEIAMMVSSLEWGGIVELALAGLASRTMIRRLPFLRHVVRRRAGRGPGGARRVGLPANDDGEDGPVRLTA